MITANRLKVFVATPLTVEHAELLKQLEPRIDLVYEPDLVGEPAHVGDHRGSVFAGLSKAGLDRYRELSDQADAHFGFISGKELARSLHKNEDLVWVHATFAGAGQVIRKLDLNEQLLDRCVFTTSAGVHARPLAEWALMAILAGAKRVPIFRSYQQQKIWADRKVLSGLTELTVLVVGLGHIGREVGRLLGGLGVNVIAVNRSKRLVEGVRSVVGPERLEEMAEVSDVIVNCLPEAVGTQKLISAQVIEALKPGGTVVSVGRGSCLDEQALIEALQSGRVGFAALDVFEKEPLPEDSPLWEMDNVLIYPHTAALAGSEDELIVRLFAQNASRLLSGKQLINIVNTSLWY